MQQGSQPGSGQQKHGPIKRTEGHTEVYEQISGDNTEQYGTGTQGPSGSLPVPRRRRDICLSSSGDVTEYPEESPHPTGAVAPTCRREYGPVNGIPAGYESDDSWDNLSHTHDHTHTHTI